MKDPLIDVLLADDDLDDCMLFKDALFELPVKCQLATVNDGVYLMDYLLSKENKLPDILFLDLNMPRKAGYECLTEIKTNEKLSPIPVVIYSTSLDHGITNLLIKTVRTVMCANPALLQHLKKSFMKRLPALLMAQSRLKKIL